MTLHLREVTVKVMYNRQLPHRFAGVTAVNIKRYLSRLHDL
jgi:hypothetical protein